jgi:acetyltransferase-like isoleucine patch superfamily enzyme
MIEIIKRAIARFNNKIDDYYRKKGVKIGKNCIFLGFVNFGSEPYLVEVGDNVKFTNDIRFITHDGGIHVLRNMGLFPNGDVFGRIIIGNNVFIGNNVMFLPNVIIGDNVVIGAGSVVTRNIPPNSVAAGVPCKVIRSIESYYNKLTNRVDNTKAMSPGEKHDYLIKKFIIKN